MQEDKSITQLLREWQGEDNGQLDDVVSRVYLELSNQARQLLQNETDRHTLQTHALVHETYLRLKSLRSVEWEDRAHFYSIAAALMRRVLVDHARKHAAKRRRGESIFVSLNQVCESAPDQVDILILDSALSALAKLDNTQARIVELRYFGGLTIFQVAEHLSISPATVKRKWRLAQAWIYREMHGTPKSRQPIGVNERY